jgi:hypothetical protein
MRSVRTVSAVIELCLLTAGTIAAPATASPLSFVPCDETSLVTAIEVANAASGDTLVLTPFCTYVLTRAHGGSVAGPTGLPPVTTGINVLALDAAIVRTPGTPVFRILEVDGTPNVPGARGRLSLTGVTVRGAAAPYGGGAIANFGGDMSLATGQIAGNTAIAGDGIHTDNGRGALTAAGITGNSATASDGGIYESSGPVTLSAATVTGNTPDNCAPRGSVSGCTG